jgi:hypothetical protein
MRWMEMNQIIFNGCRYGSSYGLIGCMFATKEKVQCWRVWSCQQTSDVYRLDDTGPQ